ncbi:tachykinin-like peptides receptor 86C, partial [Dinothrombium tinctorium]
MSDKILINTDISSNVTDCLNDIFSERTFNLSCVYDLNLFNASISIYRKKNLTDESDKINEVRPFVPEMWVQIFWSILFVSMVLGAVIGNLLVIWIILAHKKMRTKTNIFLLNLSISDLMMATMNALFNFVFMIKSHWPFGLAYCTVSNFASYLANGLSVFTITATSID